MCLFIAEDLSICLQDLEIICVTASEHMRVCYTERLIVAARRYEEFIKILTKADKTKPFHHPFVQQAIEHTSHAADGCQIIPPPASLGHYLHHCALHTDTQSQWSSHSCVHWLP